MSEDFREMSLDAYIDNVARLTSVYEFTWDTERPGNVLPLQAR